MAATASDPFVWSMIVGIGIMTFIIRFAPIALLARLELPAWLRQALPYVQPAVMAAIIAPPLFFAVGAPTIVPDLPRIAAAALAAPIAWRAQHLADRRSRLAHLVGAASPARPAESQPGKYRRPC
ncbi:MAG: AzlD domain-containing protein [Candidatus Accumulibacter sp.]|uniref:AzlD domain-containing protein n=1 Tax=Candidatus Accumulibacter proximus TaxID=2954385 RepID=A0A935Q3Y0_9PROT|nr:AzlD domain-containing protein [Candidatus Accumulibacter proximus]